MVTINTNYGTLQIDTEAKTVVSGLERERCPFCSSTDCAFHCDDSKAVYNDEENDVSESETEVAERLKFNGFLDALESFTLSLAIGGIDVGDPAYVAAMNTSMDAASNS